MLRWSMGLHQRYPHVSENPHSPNPPYRQPPLTCSPSAFQQQHHHGRTHPRVAQHLPERYLRLRALRLPELHHHRQRHHAAREAAHHRLAARAARRPVEVWATVAQNSLAAGGPFEVLNATDGNGNATYGNSTDGPFGTARSEFETATLPAWVGFSLDNEFEFHDDCNTHVLYSRFSVDTLQTVWFYRKPDNSPS